jgi:lipid-binding SYLF domain-containing protein
MVRTMGCGARAGLASLLAAALLAAASPATAAEKAATPGERRARINAATREAIARVEEDKATKELYRRAAGYAVFTVKQLAFGITGGGGTGAAVKKGWVIDRKVYMKCATGGVGFGLGAQEYQLVFLLETEAAFDAFLETGVSGGVGATAAAGDKGAGAAAEFRQGVAVFKFSKAGVMALAAISGSKFWKDDDLN